MLAFEVDGRSVPVAVRVSGRARRPRLVVDWRGEVEVVLPRSGGPVAAERLLAEHGTWLERQLRRAARPFALGLQRDDAVWIGGCPAPLPRARSLGRWYRERARESFAQAVAAEAQRLGVTYGRISIRDQRTRWGSCSAAGDLSFNWRLVMAPPDVLAYVVVHELCHRLRRDHAPAFWALVEQARPGYQEDKRWLAVHGRELLAYSVPPG